MATTMAGRPEDVKPGTTQWVLALACALLWGLKFWLIPRLNINWDEFFFLSHVHAATRGELTHGLQNSYTHLFGWLPHVGGDEVTQVRMARVLMVLLLGASALLIQRLASRWFAPAAAWTAALAFLAMWPTLKHGGSFRADSLLLPLQLGALVAMTSPRLANAGRGIAAGVLLGCATAVSIKAVLLAPVIAALGLGYQADWRRGLQRLAWLAVAAALTAVALLGAHLLSIAAGDTATTSAVASNAFQKTIRDAPLFPQLPTLREMLQVDRTFWLVGAAGLGWALWRRMWPVAACALALLPIAFYRNSFAYYYVVMWAPVCLLFAAAGTGLHELMSRVARPVYARAATLTLAVVLGAHGLLQLPLLSSPRQVEQRQLVAAVHEIFPEPVPYIDHSGMIASFRKVNFFMSSWGVEGYLARGRPFMQTAIERHQPPLLISNSGVLVPGTPTFALLLPEDQAAIQDLYQPYWGQVRIAGADTSFDGPGTATLRLPFGGRYRLESSQPVRLDGRLVEPGAVIEVSDAQPAVQAELVPGTAAAWPVAVRLLWADARPPPTEPVTSIDYYDRL